MSPPSRLLVGNLDAETDFARTSGTLPRKVLETLSGFATLLRAFAGDGDELRTILRVAPERMADVPGLPRPRLSQGPTTARDGGRPLLAWAETAEVATCRRSTPAAEPDAEAPVHEVLWAVPPPAPENAARVNHRGFCLATARDLGCALPGARMVSSPAELGSDAWVAKACFSAAGRSRYVHRGGGLDAKARRTLEHLFARHGPLLCEPWMERTDDFGCAAVLTPRTTRVAGFHRQIVDCRGGFTGLELRVEPGGWPELSGGERDRFRTTLEGVARALRVAGYLGPFGIDCWRYRRPDGTIAFHPLGEINARMTFGLVARALVDRVREPLGLAPDGRVRIVFGRNEGGAAVRRVPLLLPDSAGVEAVLEVLD
ncbi:MAG TPA: hypothetical protein VGG06_24785 [Thermoanaerobaculia bacterium]